VVGAEPLQLAFARVDLPLEFGDQAQAGVDRSLPSLRQAFAWPCEPWCDLCTFTGG
jgi:hypothetical protein